MFLVAWIPFAYESPALAQWTLTLRSAFELDATAVGSVRELSGVTYLGPSAGGERFVAVSDEEGRFVVFDVEPQANGSLLSATAVSAATFANPTFDFEGVAYTNTERGSVFASYERDTAPGTPNTPGIREYDLTTGKLLQSVNLPLPWTTNGNTRINRGFEALTRSPDGTTMWTANEEALTIDGPLSTNTVGTMVRLQRLDVSGHAVTAGPQFAYSVESIHGASGGDRSGLVELVAMPDGALLAMERSAGVTLPALFNRIYQVDFVGATDVSLAPYVGGLVGQTYTPVAKSEVFSGAVGGILGSNLEGLALGPQLASGNWLLVGVVDNGGGETGNLVVAFEASRPGVHGDYNGDGMVNAADYVVWRNNEGTANTLPNDPHGGSIGFDQYNTWRDHFGATEATGATVPTPEPGGIAMAWTLGVALLARTCRVRRI